MYVNPGWEVSVALQMWTWTPIRPSQHSQWLVLMGGGVNLCLEDQKFPMPNVKKWSSCRYVYVKKEHLRSFLKSGFVCALKLSGYILFTQVYGKFWTRSALCFSEALGYFQTDSLYRLKWIYQPSKLWINHCSLALTDNASLSSLGVNEKNPEYWRQREKRNVLFFKNA